MTTLTPPQDALDRMLARVQPLTAQELLPLAQLGGRVLAQQLFANLDVPPADNASMDGYALRLEDADQPLLVSQRISAGHPPQPLQKGTCARIFTGAEVPPGADLVVMQEKVSLDEHQRVCSPRGLQPGQNVRPRGQDIKAGDQLLEQGTRLDYRHLGLLASVGLAEAPVIRRPRVALLATGDELADPGQPLKPGQIYNSNRPLLVELLQHLGAEIIDLGRVADTREATEAALQKAAGQADLILSTGGVSVGEEDHIKPAVENLGELQLWRLAMKPGKPVAFGRIGSTAFLGLPGNPVSVFVGAQVFLRPLLNKLSGLAADAQPTLVQGCAEFSATTQIRQEYLRVRAEPRGNNWRLTAYPNQNSDVLSSVVWANALAVVPPHTQIQPGDPINFWFI